MTGMVDAQDVDMAKQKKRDRGGWARYPAQVQMTRISAEMRATLDSELERLRLREADYVRLALAEKLDRETKGAQAATQNSTQTAHKLSRHNAETA